MSRLSPTARTGAEQPTVATRPPMTDDQAWTTWRSSYAALGPRWRFLRQEVSERIGRDHPNLEELGTSDLNHYAVGYLRSGDLTVDLGAPVPRWRWQDAGSAGGFDLYDRVDNPFKLMEADVPPRAAWNEETVARSDARLAPLLADLAVAAASPEFEAECRAVRYRAMRPEYRGDLLALSHEQPVVLVREGERRHLVDGGALLQEMMAQEAPGVHLVEIERPAGKASHV